MKIHTLGVMLVVALGLAPAWAQADDAAIAQQLSATLQEAQQVGQLQGFRLSVKVDDGTVWLSGAVADEAQRTLALDKARRLPGVKLVVNDIKVQSGTPVAPATAVAARPSRVVPAPVSQTASAAGASYPRPVGSAVARPVQYSEGIVEGGMMGAYPVASQGYGGGMAYDEPQMPNHAWPSYAAHPNYGAVSYPQQYSPMAWPYIGPFYPYPQVPLGWRKVTLEWDDGWWMLDFKSK